MPTTTTRATCTRCGTSVTEPADVITRMTGRHGFTCDPCYTAAIPPTHPAAHWWNLPTAASAWRADAR